MAAKHTLATYWWEGKYNFGDVLTPFILKRLFDIEANWTPIEDAQFVGIGSILNLINPSYKGVVFSSGFIEDTTRTLPQAKVIGVRGKLTLERLTCQNKEAVVLGDGALLIRKALRRDTLPKKYRLGIIPHFWDYDIVKLMDLCNQPDVCLINVFSDIQAVLRQIRQCEAIISSSLHGLVVADSLRIPNARFFVPLSSEKIEGGNFKYQDYWSVFSMPTPMTYLMRFWTKLEDILPCMDSYARPGLEEIEERLYHSLANCLKEQFLIEPKPPR